MVDDVVVFHAPAPLQLQEIVRRFRPVFESTGVDRAFVVGSYARGNADAWSDVDLIVVAETNLPFVERGRRFAALFDAVPMGIDLLVYTPAEFEEGMRRGKDLFAELHDAGIQIYERAE